MFLQNASIMPVLAGNVVMRISIVKMVCKCFAVMTGNQLYILVRYFNIYVFRFIWIVRKFIFEDILAF